VLSQGLWLKIRFLWFQCFKSDGCELQKSNASLRIEPSEKLKRCGNFKLGS
jgi:hypothetical protein